MPRFETDLQLLNVAALLGALGDVPCPGCGIVFAVRPGSPDWRLTTPDERSCSTCGEARAALNAVTAEVGWPSPFEAAFHETRARAVEAALGREWAGAYRYAAWVEEVEFRADRGGGDVCRAAGELLSAIEARAAGAA